MSSTRRNSRACEVSPFMGVGLAVAMLLFGACSGEIATRSAGMAAPQPAAAPLSWTHFDVPEPPAMTEELAAAGHQVFQDNCASCHGESGDAKGVCAGFLNPQPRDFTTGVYRFKTTPGAQMPTDQDLFRTVSIGIHSTGMPPWQFLLDEGDRWALVAHLKTLSDKFETRGAGTPVDLGTEPANVTDDMIARGREMYVKAQCGKCHGEGGYGDGPSALTLVDAFGNSIPPRNYHKAADFKRGHTLRDIALTINTGNNGTPMPAFDEALNEEEVWDLASYVFSLAELRFAGGGTPAAAILGKGPG